MPARARAARVPAFDLGRLKPIVRALSKPYFDEEGAACAQWLSERYLAPLSSCVRLFTPPGGVPRMVRAREGYWRLEEPAVGEVDDRWVVPGPAFGSFEPRKNAVKQASIVAALRAGELRVAELTAEFGAVSSPLKTLERQGVVRVERRRRMRGVPVDSLRRTCGRWSAGLPAGRPARVQPAAFTPSPKPALTPGQAEALRVINEARERPRAGTWWWWTASRARARPRCTCRPSRRLWRPGARPACSCPRYRSRPRPWRASVAASATLVAVMHSRMGQGERYDQWDFIRSGQARVVVGARSALFTPLRDVGLVVIDEEHEGSYKQDSAPRYVARDVAAWMVRRSGGALVLGSATPSIEALYACAKDPRWHHVALSERANGKPLPKVEVVDMAQEFHAGSRSMFSGRLVRALGEELAAGRKAVLLLNQRGFAKFLLCRDCGFVPECPSCSTSLTYHERGALLACHHCGYRIPVPPVCPECGSPYLKKFGAGTQRVEAELRALLDGLPGVGPDVPIVRMDADTTAGKGAHQRLLEQFAAADAAVLLGTQMIAQGTRLRGRDARGRHQRRHAAAPARLPCGGAHVLARRAGGRPGGPRRSARPRARADLRGRRRGHPRGGFLRPRALPARRASQAQDAWVSALRAHGQRARVGQGGGRRAARGGRAARRACPPACATSAGRRGTVLPASPCVLAKLRGAYRWHIVVKCPLEGDLSGVLAPLFRARKADPAANVAVDVDPDDLL